ncbi:MULTISPECIES: EAL domain-containing protein [Microbulbifer]|uniref:EAL domain-containing protein n=1 Tax=Microbulbifer TaxID=48073 RepID=UPI001E289144|nr:MULTISPECIES: EAL domain-containing protein [Microbulbifer]UHQ54443.1 EAL domain-containing protein [Microbulbifer sp. YPW16]
MTKFDPKSVSELGPLAQAGHTQAAAGRISAAAAELALGAVADGVLVADATGRITYCNPLVAELTGGVVALLPGESLNERLSLWNESGEQLPPLLPDGAEAASHELTAYLQCPTGDNDPAPLSLGVNVVRDGSTLEGFVIILRDTTAARRLSSRLSWQNTHDALTHLPNRQLFESELQQSLSACEDRRHHHVLLYLDVYQFKVVNDTLGYRAGDQLLVQLAELLAACLAQEDLFARVGSDEFAILLRDCSIEEARRVVLRLRETVKGFSFQWEGSDSRVALSIGAVAVDHHASSVSQLLASANDACSAARDQGRNRVKLFSDSRKVLEKRRQTIWVAEIHAALREDRLLLHRQPVVSLGGERGVHHYEVLVRMRGRDGDLIPPGMFLPAAERYGLIEEVDRWVIRRVFQHMAAESGGDEESYAINISGLSLGDEAFVDFVLAELADAGVAPSRVQFEITETSAINNLQRALIFIHRLRAAGCSFALDDFGQGASSLAYLRQLPVDYLKIDGSFVRNMLDDEIDSAMVSTIDHLAKQMGISTIAEYVETPELMERLRQMGVDYAQGFGIAAAAEFPDREAGSS